MVEGERSEEPLRRLPGLQRRSRRQNRVLALLRPFTDLFPVKPEPTWGPPKDFAPEERAKEIETAAGYGAGRRCLVALLHSPGG